MVHIPEILSAEFFRVHDETGPGSERLLMHASGEVPTSGWAGLRLAPRFYADAPPDGLWEFDFIGHAPRGRVVDVRLPVHAWGVHAVPGWFRGIKVYAAGNCQTVTTGAGAAWVGAPGEPARRVDAALDACVTEALATYERAFDAALPGRRWRHRLVLTIRGPDELPMRRSLADIAASGLADDLCDRYARGGGALADGVGLLLRRLQGQLGPRFDCRVDDQAQWIGDGE